LGTVRIQQGLYSEAIDDLQDALRLRNDTFVSAGWVMPMRAGRKGEAMAVLGRMETEHTRSYISPYHIAVVYAGLGNLDRVFEWFNKACEDRDPDIMMIKVDPLWDGLRADPRFTAFLREMRLKS
jgi:tetratricopeptide (TPR) repeat protein